MIAALVLNFNKAPHLKRCLDSLLRQREEKLRIIVVDNASTDESRVILQEYAAKERIEVVVLPENVGASAGRNAGIASLGEFPEYVLFLDSDMELESETVSSLQQALEEDRSCSLTGPLVFQGEGEREIISAGGYFQPALARLALRKGSYDATRYGKNEKVDFLPGCCFLMRGKALKEVGLFHEGFDPYGMEDIDFTLRARETGHAPLFVAKARAWHLSDYSFFHETPERVFTTTRNRLLLGSLHTPSFGIRAAFLGAFLLRWLLLRSLLLLLSGNLLGAFAVLRGGTAGAGSFLAPDSIKR